MNLKQKEEIAAIVQAACKLWLRKKPGVIPHKLVAELDRAIGEAHVSTLSELGLFVELAPKDTT